MSSKFKDIGITEFKRKLAKRLILHNINSIDEIIHDFKLNRTNEIEGIETISTSTFYNYTKDDKIEGFSRKKLPMIRKKIIKKKVKLTLKAQQTLKKDYLSLKIGLNLVIGKVIL